MEVWRHEIMSVHSFSQQMRMRKRRLFCASMHQHVPYGEEHDLNHGSAPSKNSQQGRMGNCKICRTKTHFSVPHGGNN